MKKSILALAAVAVFFATLPAYAADDPVEVVKSGPRSAIAFLPRVGSALFFCGGVATAAVSGLVFFKLSEWRYVKKKKKVEDPVALAEPEPEPVKKGLTVKESFSLIKEGIKAKFAKKQVSP